MRPQSPKIALLGFMLETNGFAPIADEAEFREKLWLEGDGMLEDVRGPASRDVGAIKGFVEVMDAHGPWKPVPLALTSAGASGPVDQASYSCQCGCVFLGRVSTTVACPHCGATQPW